MTIDIDHLSLRLPHGFESRANNIARGIGAELERRDWDRSVNIDYLSLPPVSISRHEGDAEVARKVAAAISSGIDRF